MLILQATNAAHPLDGDLLVSINARTLSTFLAATLGPLCFASIAACRAPQAASSAPAIQLTPYTAPDQTASAGVPAGWKVVSGEQTVITMTGPNGETVQLGEVAVALNAPFQLGKSPGAGIELSMPYSTPLAQKLTLILQQGATLSGNPVPTVSITSNTPIQIPASIAVCGRIVASLNGSAGAKDMLAVLCSMPVDAGGTYKNIILLAEAPVATAAQAAPIARAIFGSYRLPAAWLQKKVAPFQAGPAAPAAKGGKPLTAAEANAETAMILRQTQQMVNAGNNAANCFDLSVLRETPTPLLPRSCGGNAP